MTSVDIGTAFPVAMTTFRCLSAHQLAPCIRYMKLTVYKKGQNPLDKFPRNFPVDAVNLLRTC